MSSPTNPLISIVVPAYNYARFLGACIDGVLAQTYKNWELLVVDNGSTDNTQEVIARYSDPRIRPFRIEINSGPVEAWALGYKECRGEYFAILPADDLFTPTKLERQVQYLRDHPDVNAVGTYIREIDDDGNTPQKSSWIIGFINQFIDFTSPENWRWKHYFCIPTAIYSKELCDRANAVPCDGLNNVCDWDFHVRLIGAGAKFAVIPEPLTCYRWHRANTSHKRGDANSQWVYSQLKSYVPTLRKIRNGDPAEIGNCLAALYASTTECYFVDGIPPSRRCANLEALLDPEGGLEEFASFQQFLDYSDKWTVDSENRAAMAALDSSIMDLRSRLLCTDPIHTYDSKKGLFPLEYCVLSLQGRIAKLEKECRQRESLAWLLRHKYLGLKKSFWNFADTIRGKTWPS